MRDLYGTKQGGALWSKHRTRILKRLGCKQSLADPSPIHRCTRTEKLLVSCIVDDFVITGDDAAIKRFKHEVVKEWEIVWCRFTQT